MLTIAEAHRYVSHTNYENFCARTPSLLSYLSFRALVSMARSMTTLTNLSYLSQSFPRKEELRHIMTFVNCLPNLVQLGVVLIPSSSYFVGLSEDELPQFFDLVKSQYDKIAAIFRSEGLQRLRYFDIDVLFKKNLPISSIIIMVANFITSKLVGWKYRGDGCWELQPVGEGEKAEAS